MNKTIEQAKTILFADYCEANKGRVFTGLRSNRYRHFMAGFDAAISLPLSQRLTDEEREKIKAKHNACRIAQTECDCLDYEIAADMLEEIFGKEFFGEGEGC